MNKLTATIVDVLSSGTLSQVSAECGGIVFSCVVLETPNSTPFLKEGAVIDLLFKETEVSIAVNFNGKISLRNQIPVTISRIEAHPVLSILTLQHPQFSITSIITSGSVKRLELYEGLEVTALIKANEISIMEHKSDV
ncbi:MAG: TOBE domain-containing protein [Calditrichota bacterium]